MYQFFVPDGQTETQFINSVNALWPDDVIEVTYRPAVGYEADFVIGDMRTAPEFLLGKIVKWNVPGPTGAVLELTLDNIKNLDPAFFSRLVSIVGGWGKDAEGKTLAQRREDKVKN